MRRAEADFHSLNMLPLTVQLLVAVACFTAVYIRGQAADTCPTTTPSCIPGLPGRDGKDGQPGHDGRDGVAGPAGRDGSNGTPGRDGRDGLPGPPGSLTIVEQQQLKDSILAELRDDISMLCQCSTANTSTNSTTTPTPQPGPQGIGTSASDPAISCKEVYESDPTSPSGYYWVNTTTGPVQVYCEMNTNNCGNITGGWMRAAYINMTNINNACPQGLTYTAVGSIRMCTSSHSTGGCNSIIFPTHGVLYNKVCGRAFAYQRGSDDAYDGYRNRNQLLDGHYVDGLSVTHGSPRNHIWTFAAGLSKGNNNGNDNCPCAIFPGPDSPPFVGENYFCESGISAGYTEGQWYLDDPLWDTLGCVSGSTCCNRGGPWFTTPLNQGVSDDLEIRWCFSDPAFREDIGVEQLEIYIY